jgi:hypothetical protein
MTDRALSSVGASWTDLGDWIEHSYSEDELLQFEAVIREQERQRASHAPQSNGHIMLPEASEMADYCYANRSRLEGKHHSFIDKMFMHRGRRPLSLKEKGYLASLYVQLGGKI